MTRPFSSVMPTRMVRQKHGAPKVSDNYGFLASLTGDECADVNLQVVWRNPKIHSRGAGFTVFGFHGRTAASNGYEHIVSHGHVRTMTASEAHRDLDQWSAADVLRWRRGPSALSARPRTYNELTRYAVAHGGTVIGELKSRDFASYPFISQALVEVANRNGHAAWFKSLSNMWGIEEKAAAMHAAAGPHHFAVIFGDHIHGSAARQQAGRELVSTWAPETRASVRIW